ncbi:MAG: hypothetical protein A2148_09925 [Chloroflexi bacterium RBG_16_68_14]|nr:MAG: hypothetical protein A2148_09925 [Chloroflexi bacterium RBG_16_68_14]
MEPRIQYAQTSDGVSIAFWAIGRGQPLVYMMYPSFSHVEKEWKSAALRGYYERLAEKRTVIRYDVRGCGMSERDVADINIDTMVTDLAAVVDGLRLERFVLCGMTLIGAAAIAYAATSPERVSHLVLSGAVVRGSEYWQSASGRAYRALREADWPTYVSVFGRMFPGAAELMREAITPETHKKVVDASERFDVTSLLSRVQCPTLVLHNRGGLPMSTLDAARELATHIPGARLVVYEEADRASALGRVAQAVEEFLEEADAAPPAAEPPPLGRFRTVLFTDIEGSTSLTQRLGDSGAREVLREHERITREALRAHGGSEVKTMGDGFMASFSSATEAVECAIAMQRAFASHNESASEPISVRVGLNAGEPIAEDDDLFGTAVIMAARIATRASGGEILASNVVRELVAGKGFLFADRGERALRGFEDPAHIFEVRWRE